MKCIQLDALSCQIPVTEPTLETSARVVPQLSRRRSITGSPTAATTAHAHAIRDKAGLGSRQQFICMRRIAVVLPSPCCRRQSAPMRYAFMPMTNLKNFGNTRFLEYTKRFLCAVGFSIPLWSGQAIATDEDFGIWHIFTTTDSIPKNGKQTPWSYWLDAQLRYFDVGSGTNQTLVRPALGYRVHDNLQLWLGYGRFRTRNSAGSTSYENRYFQQANWSMGNILEGSVTMRARLLQRDVSIGEDLGWVFRLSTKYSRSISADGRRTLILNLEPFVDLRDTD